MEINNLIIFIAKQTRIASVKMRSPSYCDANDIMTFEFDNIA